MKTSELTGAALDWAVGVAEGLQWQNDDPEVGLYHRLDHQYRNDRLVPTALDYDIMDYYNLTLYSPSTDWAQGGPIIEREGIDVRRYEWWGPSMKVVSWSAQLYGTETPRFQTGPTPLIAAMRCYVASKLGDDVDVPTELTKGEEKWLK